MVMIEQLRQLREIFILRESTVFYCSIFLKILNLKYDIIKDIVIFFTQDIVNFYNLSFC
jgi:hypothetical protein